MSRDPIVVEEEVVALQRRLAELQRELADLPVVAWASVCLRGSPNMRLFGVAVPLMRRVTTKSMHSAIHISFTPVDFSQRLYQIGYGDDGRGGLNVLEHPFRLGANSHQFGIYEVRIFETEEDARASLPKTF